MANDNQPDDQSDEAFASRAGALLTQSEHDLAPEVLERLTAIRRQAVTLADRDAPRALGNWAPTSALAATFLAVGIVFTMLDNGDPIPLFDDEYLAAQEVELLEDLEFLAWMELEAQGNAG